MAAEADLSLLRQHAAVILARQAAIRELKRRRQEQGLRGSLPFSTLSRLAIERVAANPELWFSLVALVPWIPPVDIFNRLGCGTWERGTVLYLMDPRGIYRERNGWGNQHCVRVKYDEDQESRRSGGSLPGKRLPTAL
jgi:hypothetical protein